MIYLQGTTTVTLEKVYQELKEVKAHLQYLEDLMVPEEKLTAKELKDLDKLRVQALQDHKAGKTFKLQDL